MPGLHGFAFDRQAFQVLELAVRCRIAGLRVAGELIEHRQGFCGTVFPEQQINQGLAQTGVTGVLAVQGAQLVNHLGPLAGDIAANAQVFERGGEIRGRIAKQAFKHRAGLFRTSGSRQQARFLQRLLVLRVLQLHQALRLSQGGGVGRDLLQVREPLTRHVRFFLQQRLTNRRHQCLRVIRGNQLQTRQGIPYQVFAVHGFADAHLFQQPLLLVLNAGGLRHDGGGQATEQKCPCFYCSHASVQAGNNCPCLSKR